MKIFHSLLFTSCITDSRNIARKAVLDNGAICGDSGGVRGVSGGVIGTPSRHDGESNDGTSMAMVGFSSDSTAEHTGQQLSEVRNARTGT
jgi:hypothetical protein